MLANEQSFVSRLEHLQKAVTLKDTKPIKTTLSNKKSNFSHDKISQTITAIYLSLYFATKLSRV